MQDNLRLNSKDIAHYCQIGIISTLIFGVFGFAAGLAISIITWVFRLKSFSIFNNQGLVLGIFSVIIFLGFNFSLYYADYLIQKKLSLLKNFNSKIALYALAVVLAIIISIYYFVFPNYIIFLYNTFWI
jgi:hypothetical protein